MGGCGSWCQGSGCGWVGWGWLGWVEDCGAGGAGGGWDWFFVFLFNNFSCGFGDRFFVGGGAGDAYDFGCVVMFFVRWDCCCCECGDCNYECFHAVIPLRLRLGDG